MITAHETSNIYIAYPFKEDNTALGQILPTDAFIDALLSLNTTIVPPIGISKFSKSGSTVNAVITDSDSFTKSFEIEPGQAYTIGQSTVGDDTFKYIRGPSLESFLTGLPSDDTEITPLLEFENKVVQLDANTLRAVKVGTNTYKGQVAFTPGYNIAITPAQNTLQSIFSTLGLSNNSENGISIEAGSGLGLGRQPNPICESSGDAYDALYKINNAPAEEGSGQFTIEVGDCFRLEPDPDNHRLILYNDCYPCCDCETYRRIARILEKEIQDYYEAKDILFTLADEYNAQVEAFNQAMADRQGLQITCSASKGVSSTDGAESHNISSVKLYIKNMYPATITNLHITYDTDGTKLWTWGKKVTAFNNETGAPLLGGGIPQVLGPKEQAEAGLLISGGTRLTVSANFKLNEEDKTVDKTFSW